jgi:hypothetical protein
MYYVAHYRPLGQIGNEYALCQSEKEAYEWIEIQKESDPSNSKGWQGINEYTSLSEAEEAMEY